MAKEPFAALLTTIWIGGLIFWMLNGCKGRLSDQIVEAKKNRNLVAGYLVQLAALAGIAYLFWFSNR